LKLSLAALLAMLVAGTAMAQAQVKWSGNIGAGFGQISYGKNDNGTPTDAYSEFVTSYEANIRATVEAGPVTAVWRLRSRGHQSGTTGSTESGASGLTAGTAGLSYAEIWWKPSDTFTVGMGRFQGQAWSQPMSGTYLIINPTTVSNAAAQNGAPEYFLNWTGIDGLDLEFNAGVVQVGLGIASECRPECADVTAANRHSSQTMVPHLTGKFGDIGIRASLPATSVKDKSTDEARSGSGYQIGVSWSGMQGVFVGFDIQSFTNKEWAGVGEDQVKTGMGLRVDFSGIQLGYWSGKTTAVGGVDGVDETSTWIKLAYFLKVSDNASIIPEYTMASGKTLVSAEETVSNSMIRLVGNVTF
jgi:hypothetical protein